VSIFCRSVAIEESGAPSSHGETTSLTLFRAAS
jgi:hypothetical protein